MASQSAQTVAEPESDPEARTPKKVTLRRAFKSFTPRELHVVSGDQVVWEIDSIGSKQSLVVESADPRFPFHVLGARGATRVKLDISYSGSEEITVVYSASLQDAFGVKTRFQEEPMDPSLTVDRGGSPPTPPDPPPSPSKPPEVAVFRGASRDDRKG